MKIAIFADVHGNQHALEGVLADIAREKVDMTICAGDAVNSFPDSATVLDTLRQENIPMVRGNHEDYVLAYYTPSLNPAIRNDIRFMPVQYTARLLSTTDVCEIDALPITRTIEGPAGDDVLICHASPSNPSRSFAVDIDEDLARDLQSVPQTTLAGGHIHMHWHRYWRDKFLVLTGSAGLPFGESAPDAQYIILSHKYGRWHVEQKSVAYDHQGAIDAVLQSDFLIQGGPMAWLTFDELITAELRIVPFLQNFCPQPYPTTMADWRLWTKRYLELLGRWEILEPYLQSAYEAVMELSVGQ